jgi:hypothetical protein
MMHLREISKSKELTGYDEALSAPLVLIPWAADKPGCGLTIAFVFDLWTWIDGPSNT